jgi:hypothetical protein
MERNRLLGDGTYITMFVPDNLTTDLLADVGTPAVSRNTSSRTNQPAQRDLSEELRNLRLHHPERPPLRAAQTTNCTASDEQWAIARAAELQRDRDIEENQRILDSYAAELAQRATISNAIPPPHRPAAPTGQA